MHRLFSRQSMYDLEGWWCTLGTWRDRSKEKVSPPLSLASSRRRLCPISWCGVGDRGVWKKGRIRQKKVSFFRFLSRGRRGREGESWFFALSLASFLRRGGFKITTGISRRRIPKLYTPCFKSFFGKGWKAPLRVSCIRSAIVELPPPPKKRPTEIKLLWEASPPQKGLSFTLTELAATSNVTSHENPTKIDFFPVCSKWLCVIWIKEGHSWYDCHQIF